MIYEYYVCYWVTFDSGSRMFTGVEKLNKPVKYEKDIDQLASNFHNYLDRTEEEYVDSVDVISFNLINMNGNLNY